MRRSVPPGPAWQALIGLQRVKFLVVDDNSHMVHIIKTILRGFGASDIKEARDAPDAFAKLRDSIDIVVTDFQMEVLDGIDFVRLVRIRPTAPIATCLSSC